MRLWNHPLFISVNGQRRDGIFIFAVERYEAILKTDKNEYQKKAYRVCMRHSVQHQYNVRKDNPSKRELYYGKASYW